MKLEAKHLAARYTRILDQCEPYLISYPGNWPALDLSPFGIKIKESRRYTATSLASREVVDGLHCLDAVTFGGQDMLMPRWVLFDCGEFPGIVFGFGQQAANLPDEVRQAYRVTERADAFVPLSMWVAIRCAEDSAWFGHNLSSANMLLKGEHELRGLATLSKILGVRMTQASKQYGATQWVSRSIALHLRLGAMSLLSAYTPAHTHPATLAYRIDVEPDTLVSSLRKDWKFPEVEPDRVLVADDEDAIRALHDEIEAGASWQIVGVERRSQMAQRLMLRRGAAPAS